MSYYRSLAGLGQEAPKDPLPPLSTQSTQQYAPSTTQTAPSSTQSGVQEAPIVPSFTTHPRNSQVPVSTWRRQVQTMLEGLGTLLMTLPGDIVAQIVSIFSGLGAAVQREVDEFTRSLMDPSQTDANVGAKLKAIADRYRVVRPSMPAPAVRLIDPIVDGVIEQVPANVLPSGSIAPVSPPISVPWGWVAAGAVAGIFACSFIGDSKVHANSRRRGRRRRRSRR